MSFLQLDAEAPTLSLEETLAFLEAFEGSSTEGSTSGGESPDHLLLDDDELGELYSTATTAPASSSEPSWSDSDDSFLSLLLLPSPRHASAPVGFGTAADQLPPARAPAVVTPQVSASTQPPTQQPRSKRKAAPSAAPVADAPVKRRVRKQPKTEILRLRNQVEELQARLAQLQKAGGGGGASSSDGGALASPPLSPPSSPSSGPRSGAIKWLDSAVDQFKALQKSEALNRKLKSEVARQTRLGRTLTTMFTKKAAQQGMEFLQELEPEKPSPTIMRECGGFTPLKRLVPGQCQRAGEAATAEDLYKSVEAMQIEAESVQREIAAESDAGAVFSSSKINHHQEFGPVFELKTNTPINFANFRELAQMFWDRAALGMTDIGQQPVESERLPEHALLATSQLHERPLSMTIRCQFGVLVLNGVSVICKLEDADRSVFTFAATLAVSGNRSMVIREHGWMIIAPHETDVGKSVFQTFYRLDSDTRRAASTSSLHSPSTAATAASPVLENSVLNDDVALRDIVMRALSDNMREFQNDVQSTLVSQPLAGFDTSKIPRSCPLHNLQLKIRSERRASGQSVCPN
ncbi:hypothetical protein PybrP1_011605 [[Pythium] brassicae (nom. inval.)]|nr:hypothetical protein PybrP1_011605 [[Pythium] brassicae (nom. inval.)]